MAFKYRGDKRTTESVSKRSKQSGGAYDSFISSEVPSFTPREGENTVRILPATWEDLDKWGDGWEIQVYLHYGVGPDNAAYLCFDKMKDEDCPVCEARRDAADEEESKELKPSWRALCWVIDRDNEKAGPMIWSMPASLFRDINARSMDKKTGEILLIDHDEEGYDVFFNREGTKLHTKYTQVSVDRDPTPIHDNEKTQDRWLDYISEHPLPDVLNYYDADYVEKVLSGGAPKSSRDEDEAPSSRGSRRGAPAEEEGRSSRGRRGRPSAEEETAEDTGASRGRRGRGSDKKDPDDDIPFEKGEGRGRRRPLATEGDEKEEAEGEAETPRGGRAGRRGGREEAAEAEPERGGGVARRQRGKPAEEAGEGEEATEGEDDSPSTQAKRQLGRLRGRGNK